MPKLWPVVQDVADKRVLMLAYADEQPGSAPDWPRLVLEPQPKETVAQRRNQTISSR